MKHFSLKKILFYFSRYDLKILFLLSGRSFIMNIRAVTFFCDVYRDRAIRYQFPSPTNALFNYYPC